MKNKEIYRALSKNVKFETFVRNKLDQILKQRLREELNNTETK